MGWDLDPPAPLGSRKLFQRNLAIAPDHQVVDGATVGATVITMLPLTYLQ
jgi:hypothetical protein